MRRRGFLKASAGVAAAIPLAGCGLGTAGGFSPSGVLAGSLAGLEFETPVTLGVGSKNYSEQILLGKICVVLLQSAGATVNDYTRIPGSASFRRAMTEGVFDCSLDYTGAAWISYLGNTDPIPGEQQQYEAVRDADLVNNVVWLPPAPGNNTYAFAVTSEFHQEYGLDTMEDVTQLPEDLLTYCVGAEFANRNDGLRPFLETYGLPNPPDSNVKLMDTGAIYEATARGVCSFGEVFTTDGRIKALDLKVVEDTKGFFPEYNICPTVWKPTLDKYPQIADLFAPVAERLDNDTLIGLNGEIDIDGREPADVAFDWMVREGFIDA